VNDWQAHLTDGRRIVTLVTKTEALEPCLDVVCVSECLFLFDNILDYTETVTSKVCCDRISISLVIYNRSHTVAEVAISL